MILHFQRLKNYVEFLIKKNKLEHLKKTWSELQNEGRVVNYNLVFKIKCCDVINF